MKRRTFCAMTSMAFAAPSGMAAEMIEFEGGLYQLHRVPKTRWSQLQLRWLDDQGRPLVHFGGLQRQLSREGLNLAFATNAGIYEVGPKPCGLTISESRELVPLNLADGDGNFFLKPNGVFYLDDNTGPGVVDAAEWPVLRLKPRLAAQSGPLILLRGVEHPAFRPDSPNKRQRSAVGIVKDTQEVVFVMSHREERSKGRVTFHQLARLFVNLGCRDALYLDGDISEMITQPVSEAVASGPPTNTFAAMFVEVR